MDNASFNITDPTVIQSVNELDWMARLLSKGFLFGKHRSDKLGTGVAFQQYRTYVSGDDIRTIDWKMFAKTDKYYVRETTIDTEHFFVAMMDQSRSMLYEEQNVSKFLLGKVMMATFTRVIANQGDLFQLYSTPHMLPPGRGNKHWYDVLDNIHRLEVQNAPKLIIPPVNANTTYLWITDLYYPFQEIRSFLTNIKRENTDVIVLHLLGEREKNLDFSSSSSFVDLETGEKMSINAGKARFAYQKNLFNHIAQVKDLCYQNGIFYDEWTMNKAIGKAIREFFYKYQFLSNS